MQTRHTRNFFGVADGRKRHKIATVDSAPQLSSTLPSSAPPPMPRAAQEWPGGANFVNRDQDEALEAHINAAALQPSAAVHENLGWARVLGSGTYGGLTTALLIVGTELVAPQHPFKTVVIVSVANCSE